MFPRFSDILNHLFGTSFHFPVQTYGFFLALAFLVAGTVIRYEFKRKEREGLMMPQLRPAPKPSTWFEIAISSLAASIIAWKLFGYFTHYDEYYLRPSKYFFSDQGSIAAFAVVFLLSFLSQTNNKKKAEKQTDAPAEIEVYPHQQVWNILFIGVVLALIGSKVFDVLDNFQDLIQNPIQSIFSFSGLTFYGGFVFAFVGLLFYIRKQKIDYKHALDAVAPALMLGYGIGRLGCHFSGDGCWGIPNALAKPAWLSWLPDGWWANSFPHNVINEGILMPDCLGNNCHVLGVPVFPTSLYESIMAFSIFIVLWMLRKKIKAPMILFGIYLIFNGLERFIIEKIRVNHKYDLLGMSLTQAEIISFLLFLLGVATIIYYQKRYKKQLSTQEELQ